jgi:hypothetical protein
MSMGGTTPTENCTKMKIKKGNRNAAKPAAKRRVPISARVLPETAAALRADKRGVGRAIDAQIKTTLVEKTAPHFQQHHQ